MLCLLVSPPAHPFRNRSLETVLKIALDVVGHPLVGAHRERVTGFRGSVLGSAEDGGGFLGEVGGVDDEGATGEGKGGCKELLLGRRAKVHLK